MAASPNTAMEVPPERDSIGRGLGGRLRVSSRRLRLLAGALSLLGLVAVVTLAAVSWHYSGRLYEAAIQLDEGVDRYDLEVLDVGEGFIDLQPMEDTSPDGEWRRDGTYGLAWESGYAQVGGIIEVDSGRVRRVFDARPAGAPPPGTAVRLDSYAFEHNPLAGRGIPYEEVWIEGELGPMEAWLIPGETSSWAIFVHGRHAERAEALRMLPAVTSSGLNALVMTYRNDAGAPLSPDSRYHWGETEWKDLEAAVGYAVEHGATDVILVGYSMGGAIVLGFMDKSPSAEVVHALILDSPAISLSSMVDLAADDMGLPDMVTWLGKRVASWRYGLDWGAIDYRDEARRIAVPVLLFHGSGDDTTPFAESEAWARERPDTVRFVPTSAGHVRSWNVDPAGYESAVAAFVRETMSEHIGR